MIDSLEIIETAKEMSSGQIALLIDNLVGVLCERTHMWRQHQRSAEIQDHLFELQAQRAIDARKYNTEV